MSRKNLPRANLSSLLQHAIYLMLQPNNQHKDKSVPPLFTWLTARTFCNSISDVAAWLHDRRCIYQLHGINNGDFYLQSLLLLPEATISDIIQRFFMIPSDNYNIGSAMKYLQELKTVQHYSSNF